jgi:ribose 5-phosphate isomerase B
MTLQAKKVAIACDHAGPKLKALLKAELHSMGIAVLDLGTDTEESVDYPDFANKVADAISQGKAEMGVLICGSGIGISIAANRHRAVRAALCHNQLTATLARQHNNANVLVMGARIIEEPLALKMLHAFFETPFEGGRHENRVAKFS